jgi:hypothetical protein
MVFWVIGSISLYLDTKKLIEGILGGALVLLCILAGSGLGILFFVPVLDKVLGKLSWIGKKVGD